jgi:peroxiredoxin (alkyl hydroperoxide reductase subunit C)
MKKLLFWYPKDFTFVCPTEIHAFQEKLEEFAKRGVQVYGASCDTLEVHMAWLDTPKDQGGIQGVTYPILSDSRRELSKELKSLIMKLSISGMKIKMMKVKKLSKMEIT